MTGEGLFRFCFSLPLALLVSVKAKVVKNAKSELMPPTRKIVFSPYLSPNDPRTRGAMAVPNNSPIAIPIAVVVAAIVLGTDS